MRVLCSPLTEDSYGCRPYGNFAEVGNRRPVGDRMIRKAGNVSREASGFDIYGFPSRLARMDCRSARILKLP
jgi:hypothetical protein